MWCVECHTTWCWSTGKIETGTIHNPEYIKYMKENNIVVPRNPLDILCGREIDNRFIHTLKCKPLQDYGYNLLHIRDVSRRMVDENLENDTLFRAKFMLKEIDEKTFIKRVQEKDKKNKKQTEIRDILLMYMNCVTDILYRYDHNNFREIHAELGNLDEHVNNCFKNISSYYNCKKYTIKDFSRY